MFSGFLVTDLRSNLPFSGYSPHAEHLTLHSGAIRANDDPESNVRPNGRIRTNRRAVAKNEANKRQLEAEVNEQVSGTPKKPVSGHIESLWAILTHCDL
jgi:hypothetical protein